MIRLIPRIAIYVRINFDVEADLGPVNITVKMPDGEIVHNAPIEQSTIEIARTTREKGNPIAGLIQRLQFGGLPLRTLGRMTVDVTIGDQKYLAGILNFSQG